MTAPGWFARTFPVPAPSWIAPAISLVLTVGALGRAQDYLHRAPRGTSTSLSAGVEVAGYLTWGALFAFLAAVTVGGLACLRLLHSRWAVLIAHAFGVGLHVAYVWTLLLEVPGSGRGVGVVAPALAAGMTHLICIGLYIGPRPRKVDA